MVLRSLIMFSFVGLVSSTALFLPSVSFAEDRKIALLIFYFAEKELQPGSFRANEKVFKAKITQMDQSVEAIAVRARDPRELFDALESLKLDSSDKIIRLEINGHGDNVQTRERISDADGKLLSDKTYQESRLGAAAMSFRMPLGLSDDLDVQTLRNEVESANADVMKTFSPLRGKFSSDAQIYCHACRFLPKDPNGAKAIAVILKMVFGIRSGSIYANFTDGQMYAREFFREPFWKNDGWKTLAMSAGMQLGVLGNFGISFVDVKYAVLGGIAGLIGERAVYSLRDHGYEMKYLANGDIALSPARGPKYLKTFFADGLTCEGLFVARPR